MNVRQATEASTNGNCVVVEVADSGTDFDADIQGKLFTAFYSTKANDMAIGLSISRSVVEDHHGEIWASARDGVGTTFTVRLPSIAAGGS